MKRLLTILLILPALLYSQKEFYHWYFGTEASVKFSDNSGPVALQNSAMTTEEGSASISDCNGNLLFYTNGSTVYNKSHAVMTNGTGLLGEGGATQNSLIIKKPGAIDIYYIITASTDFGLRYSTINMLSSGGQGAVTSKNVLLNPSPTQKIGATYHQNGTDIWVVTHYTNSNIYESFLVTSSGVSLAGVPSANGIVFDHGHGELKLNQQGTVVGAVVQFHGGAVLSGGGLTTFANFDKATGKVSGSTGTTTYGQPHGVDFSPDGTKAYVTSWDDGLLQFDMTGASFASILSNATILSTGTPPAGSPLLGPDGKVYVADLGAQYLHVVNNPNSSGLASGYQTNAVYLGGKSAAWELPNVVLPTNIDPNPNTVSSVDFCLGNQTQFSVNRTDHVVEVRWDFGDPNSGITNFAIGNSVGHVFSATGTYLVQATIYYTCGTETVNTQVIISEGPNVDFPSPVNGCPNTNIALGGSAENNINYAWTPTTGLSSSTSSNPTLNLSPSQLSAGVNSLTYTITATNSQTGCTDQKDISVTISNPDADAGPNNEVCSEDSIQIGSAAASGVSYSWTPSTGVVSPNSSLTNAVLTNTGKSNMLQTLKLVSNLNGCLDSDSVVLTVKPLPWLEAPLDTTICSNDSVQLNVGGNASISYAWTPSFGLTSNNSVSPYVYISNKTATNQTFQYVAAMQLNGCSDTDTVSIHVYPQAYTDTAGYVCPGAILQLNTFGPGTAFVWTPNVNIDNVNSANPNVSPSVSTTYYVTINDANGCIHNDSVPVLVDPNVPLEAGNDTTICREDTITIGTVASPTGSTFLWSPNKWISADNQEVVQAFPDSTIQYVLFVQNDTCTNRDTIDITVNQLPDVQVALDTNLCFKDSLWLVASGANSYVWQNTVAIDTLGDSAFVYPSTTTDYIVVGTDVNGCSEEDTATITVLPLPSIQLTNDSAVCFGDSIQLSASGGVNYTWSPSNLVFDAAMASTMAYPQQTTTFWVNVEGANSCHDSDSVVVTVNPLPTIVMTQDTTICNGSPAYLWASGGDKYLWSPATALSDTNIFNPVSTTTTPISYQVIVTDSNNCVDSSSVQVSINPNPTAQMSYSYGSGCDGFQVAFIDSSLLTDSWLWQFGDGSASIEQNPVHTYAFGSQGTGYLIAGNNGICFDTLTIPINFKNLDEVINIKVGNVITPNADGMNECFTIEIAGDFIECTRVEIFNRWGLKVYDTDNYKLCFEGINSTNNQPLNEGTYFYIISINDYKKNGFLNIVK